MRNCLIHMKLTAEEMECLEWMLELQQAFTTLFASKSKNVPAVEEKFLRRKEVLLKIYNKIAKGTTLCIDINKMERPTFNIHYTLSDKDEIVFPYGDEIETLLTSALGLDANGYGKRELFIAPGVYLKYEDEKGGWVLRGDPTDDQYDSATGQYVGFKKDRQPKSIKE